MGDSSTNEQQSMLSLNHFLDFGQKVCICDFLPFLFSSVVMVCAHLLLLISLAADPPILKCKKLFNSTIKAESVIESGLAKAPVLL